MYIPLLAALVVAVPVGVSAQVSKVQAPAKPGPAVQLSLPSPPQSGPYSKLFSGEFKPQPEGGQWRIIPEPRENQPVARKTRTKVVCGMTLILVDPAEVDPKMPNTTPKNDTRYTMRSFPAPACRDK
jgi:hypothetical protein